MTDYVLETIEVDEDTRILVVPDHSPECPRGDWYMVTGFADMGSGNWRRADVPPVHDEPVRIYMAHMYLNPAQVVRWAYIFHGLHIEYDSEHGGYWFVDPDEFANNFPDLVLGSPEHLARQAEVIAEERETYRQWADGEVYGIILEKRATWVRLDDPEDMRDAWEETDAIWGCYLDDTYTALDVAKDQFGI